MVLIGAVGHFSLRKNLSNHYKTRPKFKCVDNF